MSSSKEVQRPSPELSSPPRASEPEPEPSGDSSTAPSPTLTLGHSSPELPPLPALPALGGVPRTPAVHHPGTDNSSYYTASWGSPYQHPPSGSTSSNPLGGRVRSPTASSEIEEDSPNPRFGLSHLLPSRLPTVHALTPTRPSTPSPDSPPSSPTRPSYFANPARSLRQLFSPNRSAETSLSPSAPGRNLRGGSWWNQDDHTGEVELQASPPQRHLQEPERVVEPFQLAGIADTEKRTDRLRDKRHRSRDSNLTLTQEDFWPTFSAPKSFAMFASRYADTPPAPPPKDKEPARVKTASPQLQAFSTATRASPLPVQRTDSTTSMPSGRAKKKVVYKGKNVQIGIPQELPRGDDGTPPKPLSPSAITARLRKFEAAGYDTRGFGHWRAPGDSLLEEQAQNRGIYPDPGEDIEARKRQDFRVAVPNRLAWQAYVNHLREQKLRALGVGIGGDSDVTAAMSRQSSSHFSSSLPFSPPVPTSSAGSQRHGHHGSVFQTSFIPGSSNHTSARSVASPISSLGNPRASLHMHRQSMFASPPMLPQHTMTPPGIAGWSPQQLISPAGVVSGGSPALPEFPDTRSPISPFGQQPASHQFQFSQRDELLAQMQRQKQQQMQMHLQQQQQQQQQMQQQSLSTRPTPALEEVPEVDNEEEQLSSQCIATQAEGPEIVNPKPSHHHNISVQLEMDVQNSDYHLEESINRQLDEDDTFAAEEDKRPSDRVQSLPDQSLSSSRWSRPQENPQGSSPAQPLQLPQRTSSLDAANGPSKASSKVASSALPADSMDVDFLDSSNAGPQSSDADNAKPILQKDVSAVSALNPWIDDPTFHPRDPSPVRETHRSNHSSKSSTSKLNVTAKEFNPSANPSASFNPGIFNSSLFSFQPAKAKPFVPNSGSAHMPLDRESRHSSRASISGLSAAAPVFSPKTAALSSPGFGEFAGLSPSNSEFSFVSKAPTFKPTAPVFQPASPVPLSDASIGASGSDRSGKIFTNISISDVVKPARRSKAIPIVAPTSHSNFVTEEEKEDEDGRITQGDLRQKRARRAGSDGDQVPQFALPSSDNFQTGATSTDASLDRSKSHDDNSQKTDTAIDVIRTPPAETTGTEAETLEIREKVAMKPADILGETELPAQGLIDTVRAPAQAGAEPSVYPISPVSSTQEEHSTSQHDPNSESIDHVSSSGRTLSASATPFEIKPNFEIDPELKNRMASHLTAGQFTGSVEDIGAGSSPRSTSSLSKTELDRSSDALDDDAIHSTSSPQRERLPSSVRYYDELDQPSFQEIDAIIQHFNEEGSDAGVERDEPSWPNTSPREDGSPRPISPEQPNFPVKSRSDAPSPSPRRYLLARPRKILELDSASITQDPFSDGRAALTYDSPVHRLNDGNNIPVSDWDDIVSSAEDDQLQTRSIFFDSRVSDLIGSALENRLAPLEERLQQVIKDQLAPLQAPSSGRRVRSRATIDSDADDEDEEIETDAYSRGWSPKRDRRMEKFKVILQDALTASQMRSQSPSLREHPEISELHEILRDMKESVEQSVADIPRLNQLRDVVNESVSQHGQALIQNKQAILAEDADRFSEFAEKLKEAAVRVNQETEARREAERREEETSQLLKLTQKELELAKESALKASTQLVAYEESPRQTREEIENHEKIHSEMSKRLSVVTAESEALKETLEEYRISSDKWRDDIEQASIEKERVLASFSMLKLQTEEALRIRETMRTRIERLQADMSAACGQVATERAKWTRSDAEHRTRYEVLSARIEAEARTRERLERELERLETQEREAMRLRVALEQAQKDIVRLNQEREKLDISQREAGTLKLELVQTQKENSRLEDQVNTLRLESSEHQKLADQYAREFREARDAGRMEVQRTRGLMEVDVEAANNQVNIVRADLESEIARVRAELENVRMEADTAKAKHELVLEQEADAKRDAVQAAADAKHAALQELRLNFEERLEELRKQHRRDLDHVIENKNQSETFLRESHDQKIQELQQQHDKTLEHASIARNQSESQFKDRLSLADSKVEHLQDKILHLEEKLQVAKSAAHAAALAAQTAKVPTSAPASSNASRMPEKISPQALRESIAVLQEQLQERELRIESLEQELSEVDKEAPAKMKARDTEIGWLRELLGVRIDDLSDLVNVLAQPAFDRDAVRNAAIRIRASIQMEQQDKERQMSGSQTFPTLASISSFASPKAAQLAAAIGSWRRGGGMAPSGLSQSVSGFVSSTGSNSSSRTQTPSKPPPVPQSFLTGLMTPPASNVRKTPSPDLVISSGSSSSRPLSSLSKENRLSRSREKMPTGHNIEPPATPPLLRRASYDQDAEESTNGYYDDEESTIGGTPRTEGRRGFEPLSFGPDMESMNSL